MWLSSFVRDAQSEAHRDLGCVLEVKRARVEKPCIFASPGGRLRLEDSETAGLGVPNSTCARVRTKRDLSEMKPIRNVEVERRANDTPFEGKRQWLWLAVKMPSEDFVELAQEI